MRLVRALHDLALAIQVGGIVGVGLSVWVLFARAPSREIAGRIGGEIFGLLAPAVLLLASIVFGARLVLRSGDALARPFGLTIASAALIIAAANALWLTPRMAAIWAAGAHAADGSGLAGEDRHRFLMLHGISNVAYLAILLLSVGLMLLGSRRSSTR